MKKELIKFCFDIKSVIPVLELCDIKYDFDEKNNKLKPHLDKDFSKKIDFYKANLSLELDGSYEFEFAKEKILQIEDLINIIYESEDRNEIIPLVKEALNKEFYIQGLFSSNKSNPLLLYPLFSRWFISSAIINVYALNFGEVTCLQSIEFWKSAKEFLDKAVIFIVSKLKIDCGCSELSLPRKLHELYVFKKYNFLSTLQDGIEFKDNSLMKREDLLEANEFIDYYTLKIVNLKL